MMTKYGLDTVAILRYLTGSLPPELDRIFTLAEENKNAFVVPSIVIGELIYTIRKGKEVSGKQIPEDQLELIISTLFSSSIFSICDLSTTGWEIFMSCNIPELHDRMIVATCKQEDVVALITSDGEITASNEIPVIWK